MNNRLFALGLVLALLMGQYAPSAQCKEKRLPALNLEVGKKAELTMLLNAANSRPYFGRAAVGIDESTTGIRGGNGAQRPLGQYLVAPNCEFSSAYTKESTETMCQFAYALHRFVALKGRDYDSYLLKFSKNKTGFNYLPMADQRAFAKTWWEKQKSFNDLDEAQKSRFIDEAVIDATNLYGRYATIIYATSDYVAWQKGAVRALVQPKPYRSCD
ncbi:MAG: hypothetical protein Q8T09_00425 [Candidatus Melainabacteria bacterium]|nr:hypothetical protein [Candidatus Melainabacteria bacterium]